jgi:hypothetical protein
MCDKKLVKRRCLRLTEEQEEEEDYDIPVGYGEEQVPDYGPVEEQAKRLCTWP